ncbi:MAG: hypothetical protein OES47_03950 [Acidobacteriota bacterium]|nr:hypothetical protein [Acidobacteriota bacterium]
MTSLAIDAALEVAAAGNLYPAVILHGADLERRRETALLLGRILLCSAPADRRPCEQCRNCRRIVWPGSDGGFHPDFQVLERDLKTVTSVEATKQFLRGAHVSPFEARGQVFVIASAETLNGEAANALLKTLEEPPTSAPRHFLLLAPSQLDLLPTLRSRSLAIFLGTGSRPRGEDLVVLAGELSAALSAYSESGNTAELVAAAKILKQAGSFKDAGASEPWERAASVVLRAAKSAGPDRGRLLRLAQDLLEAPPLRARGVSPDRLLEGRIHQRLAGVS